MHGRVERSQVMLFVRPLAVLTMGVAAAGAAWWLLMQEPPRRPAQLGAPRETGAERLARGEGERSADAVQRRGEAHP